MITGHLAHWDKEKHLYAPAIQKAITWLQINDLAALPTGRQEIDGEKLYALVSEYSTEPKEKRRAEAHRKYVDVQYIVKGTEIVGYSPMQEGLEVLEDKLVEKDAIFYKNPPGEVELILETGMFAVLFPWEVHRPNCLRGEAAPVRKVVLKINMETLQ
ncbi:MAG: YhcH/YjgK/YiaL family protein [Negativicutes bacterium]